MPENHSHKGHRQRLREKYMLNGLDSFKLHEALELYLFYAIPYKDTNELAHRLIDRFGSLAAVFDAPPSALREFGLSDNTVALIKLLPDMSRLYQIDRSESKSNHLDVFAMSRYFEPYFFGMNEEAFRLVLLDRKCKVLFSGVISRGSINATIVPIRKIVELALYYNASFAAIAHNHPNGVARPSELDIVTTKKVFMALRIVGVKLVDHVIVANDDSLSLAMSGIGIFGEDVVGNYGI